MDYKKEIIRMCGVIPDSIRKGSVQQSVRWKEQAVESLRVANNPKSSEYELRTAYNHLKRYS
jgi:hypothetical protein